MTIVFVHVPKTAGSTLQSIIYHLYEPNQILRGYAAQTESHLEQQFKAFTSEQQLAIEVVFGHFPYGVCTWLTSQPCTYITILRNPVDRIISHYYFVRRAPGNYLYKTVMSQNMNLKEYVASGISREMDNGQTRMLCGPAATNIPFGECNTDMLHEAKRNLCDQFAVVGLTEDFDRSVILMKQMFGWKWPFYVAKNRTRHRPDRAHVAPETIQIIEEYNQLDIALYTYAGELFRARIQQEGEAFEQEVRRFKSMNASMGKFYSHLNDAHLSLSKILKKIVSLGIAK